MLLSTIINNKREHTISLNYNTALAELCQMVECSPYQCTFSISAGCISSEITHQIAKRFNNDPKIKAIVVAPTGRISTTWSIMVTCPLDDYLNNDV